MRRRTFLSLVGGAAAWSGIDPLVGLFGGCPDDRYNTDARLQVIAHRGYTREFPENTVQSCRVAMERGATALEIDLCFTKDAQVVLWHDWDPNTIVSMVRPADAYKIKGPPIGDAKRIPVIELSYEELQAYYGHVVADHGAAAKANLPGGNQVDTAIPTLNTFIAAMSGWEKRPTALYLDIKMPAQASGQAAAMIDRIIDVVRDHPIASTIVVVMVPVLRVLQIMKARAAERGSDLRFTWDVEFPVGIVVNPRRYSAIDHATGPVHATIASVGRPTAATLFPWRTYRAAISYDIRKWRLVNSDPDKYNAGNRVDWLIAWTINDPDEMACLTRMGVSGIITDRIETLAAVARAEGRA